MLPVHSKTPKSLSKPVAIEIESIKPVQEDMPDSSEDMETAPADQDDSEINSALGEELMSAIESKDKKRIMEGLEALVLSCLSKE